MKANILHCSFSFIAGANKSYVFTALFIAFSIFSTAQTLVVPELEWQKSLGGSLGDGATSIQETEDGGYITAGYSSSNDGNVSGNHGGADYWIVKLSDKGIIQWQKSLGGTGNDIAYSIDKTEDGGYIIAGYSASNDGDVSGNHGGTGVQDYWVVKLDGDGTIQWQKSLGGTGEDIAYYIEETSDLGYIVAGTSKSNDGNVSGHHGNAFNTDYWIVKLSSLGAIEWEQSFGGSSNEYVRTIKQTPDGGYIAAGSSNSSDGDVTVNKGFNDYWIIKLDGTGTKKWQKSYGGSSSDAPNSIENAPDGGFIIAGSSNSMNGDVSGNHGGDDCWIVKLTADYVIPPTTYITNSNGDWNDPGIWLANEVPPQGASVIVRHTVWVNVDIICGDLKLEPGAYLTVSQGISLKVLH